MEPNEALGVAAQVAVALAGFAGVVVVFRSGSLHEWSKADKFRLRLLLSNSLTPLGLCLVGVLLLSAKISPDTIWRWCSGVAAAVLFRMAVVYVRDFRGVPRVELQTAGASAPLFYVGGMIGTLVTLLQLYNTVLLNAFWPFFLAIVTLILAAMVQFVRLVIH